MKSKGWILGFDFVTMTLTLFLRTGFCVEWTPPPPPPPGYLPFISPFLTCASCRVFHQTSHSASNISPQPASLSFSQCPLFPLPPSPHGPLPMSPTDPITECFLTGTVAEEAGASLLLWCDQTLRYTPTDQGRDLCVYMCIIHLCLSF